MVSLASLRAGLMPARPGGGGAAVPVSAAERAFEEAERHTARVRFLRKAIPIACAAALLIVILARFLNPFSAVEGEISVSSTALQGSKLTMEQPKLSGFKKDAKAYEVTADAAVQDIKKPNIVELNHPVARIEMQKGTWARLAAEKGIYDATTEKLRVEEKVNVKTDTGFEMRLSDADIDFKAGTVVTLNPADVTLPNGWVKSDRMSIFDNGKSAVFEGNVKSEFTPADPPETAEPTTGAQR